MKMIVIVLVSFLADLLWGDPPQIPHPVILMGKCISILEKWLRQIFPETEKGELAAGCVLAVLMTGGTLILSGGILFLFGKVHPLCALALQCFWGWQCLALRGLKQAALAVEQTLKEGTIEKAREMVGHIVGRDTDSLTKPQIIRAAVESVAENFSDGVIAPLFCLALGGAPLALCYKAVNTMDSMVGYRNERYLYFGRIPARLDDAANFLPSRLAALLLIGAALIRKEDAAGARRIWRRDRRKHPSPNSAQTESAMAGALDITLGGPASYFGTVHEKQTLGDPVREVETEDISRAVSLMVTASFLGLGALCIVRAAAAYILHSLV